MFEWSSKCTLLPWCTNPHKFENVLWTFHAYIETQHMYNNLHINDAQKRILENKAMTTENKYY